MCTEWAMVGLPLAPPPPPATLAIIIAAEEDGACGAEEEEVEGGEVLLACGGRGPPTVAPLAGVAVPGLAIDGGDVPLLFPLVLLHPPTGVGPTAGWAALPPTGSRGCVARSSSEGGSWVWSGLCLG